MSPGRPAWLETYDAAGRPARGLTARAALIAFFAAAASLGVVGWTAWRGLRAADAATTEERRATAAAVARSLDRTLADHLAHLEGLSTAEWLARPEADVAATRAAVHEMWVHLRLLEDVAIRAPDGRLVASAPGMRPRTTAPFELVREVAVSGRPRTALAGPLAARRLHLLVPLAGPQGSIAAVADGSLALAAPATVAWVASLVPRGHDGRLEETLAGTADDDGLEAALELAPLVVRLDAPALGAPARVFALQVVIAGPVLTGIALLLAWGTGRSIKVPLVALGRAADRIAAGELDVPVPAQGADEVGRLAGALEAMRQALVLREKDRVRGQLLGRVIQAQEEERKRIARELHDETCQTLSALSMRLDAVLPAAEEPARRRLAEARALAGNALDEVHHVIHALRPAMLDDLGLVDALRACANRMLPPLGTSVRFEAEELSARLPPDVETAVFRAAQEALANVARHAGAEHVLIQIAADDGALRIEIEDDGAGFDPAAMATTAASGRGLGLTGMRERMELVGGTTDVVAAPGQGTRVVLSAPLPVTRPRRAEAALA